MSLKNNPPGGSESLAPSLIGRVSELLRRHYETWSSLYVEQRVGMFESEGD
jgi:hypothetical protein